MDNIIKTTKEKIKLKLWTIDYAKGYCYAMLAEKLYHKNITNEEYDKYSKIIDDFKQKNTDEIIIKSPVNIGDILYVNFSRQGDYLRKKDRPYKVKVEFIGINGVDNFFNVTYLKTGNMWQFKFSDIGKHVFITKEEAKIMEEK